MFKNNFFIYFFAISYAILNVQLNSLLEERQRVKDFVFDLAGSKALTKG